NVMLLITAGTLLVLVTTAVSGLLVLFTSCGQKAVGDRTLIVGVGLTEPVPLMVAVSVQRPLSVVTVSVAVRDPVPPGVKVRLIVRVPPPGTVPAALPPVKANSLLLSTWTSVITNGSLPGLVNTMLSGALVVPCTWLGNTRLVGVNNEAVAVPTPDTVTRCGLPVALLKIRSTTLWLP